MLMVWLDLQRLSWVRKPVTKNPLWQLLTYKSFWKIHNGYETIIKSVDIISTFYREVLITCFETFHWLFPFKYIIFNNHLFRDTISLKGQHDNIKSFFLIYRIRCFKRPCSNKCPSFSQICFHRRPLFRNIFIYRNITTVVVTVVGHIVNDQ